jgi:hypothetical protein
MSIYKNLNSVKKLTNSSLTSIIDLTNKNFSNLSSATLEFLNKINYNEDVNSFSVNSASFDSIEITNILNIKSGEITTFSINSLGKAEGQQIIVKVAETQRLRLSDFPNWPDSGIPGEIIYTGIQNTKPEFGEDFIGYLQGRGWVSLTSGLNVGILKYISNNTIINIPEDNQYLVYGDLTVDGVINNFGEIVIINGSLNVLPGGQVNSFGSGITKVVNLSLGTSMQVVVQSFIATGMVPVNINHGLGTKDFTYTVRDGNQVLSLSVTHVDDNNITLLSGGNINNGSIILQAKLS